MTRMIAGMLLLALVAACSPPNASPLESLKAMEEASLFYPGSTQLGEIALPEEHGMDGPQLAEYGHQLGSNVSAADIEQFYVTELGKRGWIPATSNEAIVVGIRGTTEVSARAWEKRDAIFRLGFPKKGDDPRLPAPSAQAAFVTIYEAEVFQREPPSATPTSSGP